MVVLLQTKPIRTRQIQEINQKTYREKKSFRVSNKKKKKKKIETLEFNLAYFGKSILAVYKIRIKNCSMCELNEKLN